MMGASHTEDACSRLGVTCGSRHGHCGMIRLQARARVAGASTRGHSVLSDERVVVQVASRAPPAHGGIWI